MSLSLEVAGRSDVGRVRPSNEDHFGYDEKNTPRQLRLLIKTGGGDPNAGQAAGIHWHMNIANVITYQSDEKHQVIPYVKIKDMNGNVTEYVLNDATAANDPKNKVVSRRMDCVDCHNRPTHIYVPPDKSVDEAITAHRISIDLPYSKQQGVQVLTASYKTTDEAVKAIATTFPAFYKDKYPDLYASHQQDIQKAVSELQRIFKTTIFPEMKVNWQTHPNNVGHFYFQGCFRCHDGNHVSADGKVISKTCDSCHTMLSEQAGGTEIAGSSKGAAFQHPVDLGDLTQVNCSNCHTGGVGP